MEKGNLDSSTITANVPPLTKTMDLTLTASLNTKVVLKYFLFWKESQEDVTLLLPKFRELLSHLEGSLMLL
jgi:hypothetical protein